MTARRAALLALYWTAVLGTAAVLSLTAAIPFTGVWASVVSVVTTAGVCLVGIAWAPNPGGTR